MSEVISMDEQTVEQGGIVELGCASKETRGSIMLAFDLDGLLNFPYIFWQH